MHWSLFFDFQYWYFTWDICWYQYWYRYMWNYPHRRDPCVSFRSRLWGGTSGTISGLHLLCAENRNCTLTTHQFPKYQQSIQATFVVGRWQKRWPREIRKSPDLARKWPICQHCYKLWYTLPLMWHMWLSALYGMLCCEASGAESCTFQQPILSFRVPTTILNIRNHSDDATLLRLNLDNNYLRGNEHGWRCGTPAIVSWNDHLQRPELQWTTCVLWSMFNSARTRLDLITPRCLKGQPPWFSCSRSFDELQHCSRFATFHSQNNEKAWWQFLQSSFNASTHAMLSFNQGCRMILFFLITNFHR